MKEIIKIPNPCSQRFDNFSKTEKGGFCRSCQKEVMDFRTMSPNEISDYFLTNSGKSCGIFKPNQLKQQKITFKQSKFSPLWIIGFIGITGISLPAFSQTPVQASIEQTPIHHLDNKKNDNTSKTKRTIKGKVISSYFNEIQPLPGTSILLKGFRTGTNADLDGNFELEVPDSVTSQKLILSLTFIGYKPKEITIYDTQLPVQLGEILLSEDEVDLMGEIIYIKPNFWQRVKGAFKSEKTQTCTKPDHKHS